MTTFSANFGKPFGTRVALDAKPRPAVRERRVGAHTQRVLRAVRPNAGIRDAYQGRIDALIDEMGNSVLYWLRASYRRNEPAVAKLAQDTAAGELGDAVRRLRRRWEDRFGEMSEDLAAYFAKAVVARNDNELKRILKKAGWTVDFKLTAAVRDVLNATVAENVSLIRSIPQRYLTDVEGAVMRSVVAGRDLGQLSDVLRHDFGVTKRRAGLISLDQNNKISGAVQRVRFLELGIEKAVWRHSHAGKTYRRTHVANDGKEYDIGKGWYDPDEGKFIRPGELVNCRCYSTPVLPGF